MYIVTPSKDFLETKGGETYLLERVNAAHLLMFQKPEIMHYFNEPVCHGDDGVLVVRPGGIGDLVHLSPTLKALEERHGEKVDVAVAERYMSVVRHHPSVRHVIQYPTISSALSKYKKIYWPEDSVEEETELHMADAFLEACGFDHTQIDAYDKRPRLYFPEAYRKPPKVVKKRLGIQCKASAKCRTPEVKQLAGVMEWYVRHGWEIYIFGAPGEVDIDHEAITNTTQYKKPLSILESAHLMQTCELFIAPDSGLLHIASALRIPSVGLYGPFPADLRVRYSPFCVGVEAKAPCAPCFWHSRGKLFPDGCPGAKKNKCMVLDAIQTKTIVEAGEVAMGKKKGYESK